PDKFVGRAESPDLENARVGDLRRLLGKLDPGLPLAIRPAKSRKLVNPAERRLIERRDQFGSDAPHVDLCALLLETLDNVLVQVIAADDRGPGESRRIQNFPGLNAQERQVA